MARLRNAVEVASEVKSRKRKYIQTAETLTVGEIADLITEKESGGQEGGGEPGKKVRTQRRCGRDETGHNARICAVEFVDASDSDKSE